MEIAGGRHDLGIAKGEMLSSMYTDVEKIVKEAKTAATTVRTKCDNKIEESESKEKECRSKVASATDGDKVSTPWMATAESKSGRSVLKLKRQRLFFTK
jgi:Sec-independent protein translocase protein TatA